MHILITGGSGYLGSRLVGDLLAEGARVTVMDNGFRSSLGLLNYCSHKCFHFVQGDVRDHQLVRHLVSSADSVVHLAALVGQPQCADNPEEARQVNIRGTEVVLESLAEGQQLIFCSTASVYGQVPSGLCSEEDAAFPVSEYARSKLSGESISLSHGNAMVLRLATLFGASPSMRFDLLPHQMILEGLISGSVTVYEGDVIRPFIHVGEVSRILATLAFGREFSPGLVVNVGDQLSTLSKNQLAKLIAEALGVIVKPALGYSDPDLRNYAISTTRLQSLGFEAQLGFQDSLQEIIQSCRLFSAMQNSTFSK